MQDRILRTLGLIAGVVIAIIASLAAANLSRAAGNIQPSGMPRDLTRSLKVGNLVRTFDIHLPPSYDGRHPFPLVLAFHGGGGDAAAMKRLTHLNEVADRRGFLVVYPDGIGRQWNDGRPEVGTGVDDVGFVSTLLDSLEKEYRIDLRRVFAAGISNGGMFCFRLACEIPERIAAIAPVAALMGESLSRMCSPSRPVPVLIIHGTEDPLVPWEGGDVVAFRHKRGRVISASATVAFWVRHNGCPGAPVVTYKPDKDPGDGTRVRWEVHGGGRENTEVILCAIEGGGHTWPGGRQYLPQRLVGRTCRDMDAGEVLWEFFTRHSRK